MAKNKTDSAKENMFSFISAPEHDARNIPVKVKKSTRFSFTISKFFFILNIFYNSFLNQKIANHKMLTNDIPFLPYTAETIIANGF